MFSFCLRFAPSQRHNHCAVRQRSKCALTALQTYSAGTVLDANTDGLGSIAQATHQGRLGPVSEHCRRHCNARGAGGQPTDCKCRYWHGLWSMAPFNACMSALCNRPHYSRWLKKREHRVVQTSGGGEEMLYKCILITTVPVIE